MKLSTLKHDLKSLQGAIEVRMYEHRDCTKADVDLAIQHLDPNMLQDIPKCPNNLDISKGQHCKGNIMTIL